jgi:DNA invertase Pin-like site-specific DNA recombinase
MKSNTSIVAYYRVSKASQGIDGLGIEAQRQAVESYLNHGKWKVTAEFVEVETGKRSDRPELTKALALAKVKGCPLAVAKVDRLTRSVSFLSRLLDAGVIVHFTDLPRVEGHAGKFLIQQMASVAELEAGMISDRTKAALKAAKARGVKLGNPNGAAAIRRAGKGNKASIIQAKANADQRAHNLAAVVRDIRKGGALTLKAIANELNSREIVTPRGGSWHQSSVSNLLRRIVRATV